MMRHIRSLWAAREVIEHLVRREVKVRYKGSVLGFFWSFLRPLFIMMILTVVFVFLAFRVDIPYVIPCRLAGGWTGGSYPVFLLVALIPWFFTIGALHDAVGSLIGNASIIRKVSIPGEIFPLSAVLANLVNFFFSLCVLLPVVFLIFEVPLQRYLLLLPILVTIQLFMTIGFAYILALGNVFFRDVGIIFDLIAMIWFYLTPIFYPLSYVQQNFAVRMEWVTSAYLLNPMTVLVHAYRWILLHGVARTEAASGAGLTPWQLGIAGTSLIVWTVAFLGVGLWLFRVYRHQIPDEL